MDLYGRLVSSTKEDFCFNGASPAFSSRLTSIMNLPILRPFLVLDQIFSGLQGPQPVKNGERGTGK